MEDTNNLVQIILEHNKYSISLISITIRDNDIDIEEPNTITIYDNGMIDKKYDPKLSHIGSGVCGTIILSTENLSNIANEDYTLRLKYSNTTSVFRLTDFQIANILVQADENETIVTFTASKIDTILLAAHGGRD